MSDGNGGNVTELNPSRPELDRSGYSEYLLCPECDSEVVAGDPSCRTHPDGGCEGEPERCEGWWVFWEGTREDCDACDLGFFVELDGGEVASLARMPDPEDCL